MPMRALTHPGGRKTLDANPTTMPGNVMTFGRILCCRSVTKSTMSAHANSTRTNASGVRPYVRYVTTKTAAVTISTAGYIQDTGWPHVRHRPPRTTQLRTGRLSNQDSMRPHDVQRDRGWTTD